MAKNKAFDLNNFFLQTAKALWPALSTMSEPNQLVGAGEVITFLYTLPLAIYGLIWLIASTDVGLLRQEVPIFLLILAFFVLFAKISYFIIIEIRQDRYGSGDGSLAMMVLWSAVFVFGPTVVWLAVIWAAINFGWSWLQTRSPANRWNLIRNLTAEISTNTFALLLSYSVYTSMGAQIPIAGLTLETIFPAFLALGIHLFLVILIWSGFIIYHLRIQKYISGSNPARPILVFFLLIFGLPYLANPFAILAAGLYVENGFPIYLFFLSGMVLVAYITRRLSWAVESARQQSRQLEKLEQLGRAIIDAPPDISELSAILKKHVPAMFPSGRYAIWISPDNLIFKHPDDWESLPVDVWAYVLQQKGPQSFTSRSTLPWDTNLIDHNALVVSPILNVESGQPVGGIYVELRTLVQPWDTHTLANLFPAVQTLSAQIASALHQYEIYRQTLEYQKISQELQLAGKIQASFLPNQFPNMPGWQLAVTLLPARETSGDFFDVIPLSNGRLGVLIADVADKGVGPALYMALSRTLLRTYAVEYDADPDVIFYAANERLLKDSRASLFVTAFYGVLDPDTGTLTYCNAGHNPPYLFRNANSGTVHPLARTGMALGVEGANTWTQASVSIEPGDVLILYTDGIPDAQNDQGEFFDSESLIDVVQANLGLSAHELQAAVLESVQNFAKNAPQFDDITLMILERDV